jgi:Ca2+-binding EF-hand superfamily protein
VYAEPLTKALFAALDTNKDGKLSRAEVKAAARVLADLDVDEDECLVPLELVPSLFTSRRTESKKQLAPFPSFRLMQPRESRSGLLGRPGVEATVCLGDEVKPDDSVVKKGNPQGVAGRLVVRLGKQEFDLATGAPGEIPGSPTDGSMKQFLAADRQRRGFVRPGDLDGAEFKSLRRLLPLADRDGDGKLTREELDGYLRLSRLAEQGIVTLTLAGQARGWFAILDSDHDGRLSVSELRSAWQRLADEEANRSGFLTLERSRQTFSLTFSRGLSPARGMAFYLSSRRPARKGPKWFRAMDRNGDGFISRREFLGSKTEFDRLDRDGDGLISLEEAEAGFPKK